MNPFDILSSITEFDFADDEARRMFHGRGQFYPDAEWINIDWYAPFVLIILYGDIESRDLEIICDCLLAKSSGYVEGVIAQQRNQHKSPTRLVWGKTPEDPHVVTEKGLRYYVNLMRNQNTGFFVDMANGRDWVAKNVKGKRVLNLFSYTCSFSVVALKAGAECVINVDMSKGALSMGRRNHELNHLDTRKAKFLAYNIFKSWSGIRRNGPYDLIIMDPPEFQKGSFLVEKDYAKLIRHISELMPNGGQVLATLNSPKYDNAFLIGQFEKFCPEYRMVEQIRPPDVFKTQKAETGLKTFVFQKGESDAP